MAKKKIIILGAGLAGLSAAWHLQKRGMDCLLFEKEPEAGGLCRSKKIGGFTFDYDGHVLHFKHRYTFGLLNRLLGENLVKHCKNSWIYSYGRYTHYPFQANLYGLPSHVIKECLLGFVEKAGDNGERKPENFMEWINKTFGRGMAKYFMIPYNHKFWTIHPQEMTCSWLDSFILVPSLNQVIEGTIKENKAPLGYNAHFWYPKKGGINQLSLAFASEVKNIFTNSCVRRIDLARRQIEMDSGRKENYDYLISTMPLPELPYLIRGLPKEINSLFKRLKWNSIYNLNLGINANGNLGRHWVYFPEKELSFFRVGFYNNFSSHLAPAGLTSLYAEVSYSKKRPIDKKSIVSVIEADLVKAGILLDASRICCRDVNDIEYGYPIYDKHYSVARDGIIKYLLRKNILTCGRYGSWRYFSMEDTILDGREVSSQLAAL